MNAPNVTDLNGVFDFINNNIVAEGVPSTLFFDIIMMPIFLIIIITSRSVNVGDNIDCLNISSFVCLFLSFVLSSIGYVNIVIVGVFLAMLCVGLLLKRFTSF